MVPSNKLISSTLNPAGRGRVGPLLASAELLLLGLVAALCIACVASAALAAQAVDWAAFFPAFGASVGLVMMGAYIRATRQMPRIALGAIGFGVFMCFTGSVAIFIYTLFPLSHPLTDQSLMAFDAALGLSWLGFVNFVASYPTFGIILHYVYLSILPQVVGVIILLSYLNQATVLHLFLTVGIISMIVTIGFWWLFPSVGPAAFGMVSEEVQAKISLIANAAYGAQMRELATEGIALIAPDRITGVIAFPSFHMVMACMVVWFTRATWAFFPALLINTVMLPATIVHGGHHFVDLLGGALTFVACLWVGMRLVPEKAL